MAVWRVQVHYTLGLTGKWSNVWHVRASGLLAAASAFEGNVVGPLIGILHPDAVLDRLLVSDPLTSGYTIIPVNESGTSADSGSLLPLFNSVKASMPTAGLGRPDLKYIKGFLTETLQDNGLVIPGAMNTVDTALSSAISDMATNSTPLVSSFDEAYSQVTIQERVQMRQMHRKRRRTTPTP